MGEKPELVALNKTDLLGGVEDARVGAEMLSRELGREVLTISAASGAGCRELLEACWEMVVEARRGA